MKSSLSAHALLAASICVLCGCGGTSTAPVSGVVTHDGVPLKSGSVSYVPESPPAKALPPIVGTIKEDGTYALVTGAETGAPPGAYKVVVTSSVPTDPKDPYSLPKSVLPAKYAKAETTDLRVEVASGAAAGAYDLKLTGKP